VIELARGLRRSSLVIDALSNPLIELPTAPEDILRTYAGVHALKKQQPPLVVAPQHKVQEWQSYTAVAAQTQLKKLAAEVEAETAEQLAAEIVQRWPRQIAIRGVGETRRFLESQVAESNGKTTFAQAAQSMAANWPAEFVRDIARQFEKSPGASDAQIVDSLQPATVLALHEQGVGNLVDMVVKDKLFAEFRSKLQEALQARGQANGPEDINAYLQVILQTAIDEILGDARVDEPINPSFEHLSALFDAYREDDAETFGDQLQAYQAMLAEEQPGDVNLAKVRFEAYFNQLAPFYLSCLFYLFAFVLAVVAWLGWSRPLNRAAFWLIVFSLLLHTFALCGRIYISGRPPVTNLYSSALFIGWGCVVFGLVMELIYRLGIGNVVASLTGFGALLVGHLLTTMPEHRGDTLNVLQAVLDTQVWLATHVVCITLGYATTFLAGMLACIYIIGHWAASIASGLGNRDAQVTPRVDKAMVRMIYGALCFALFFSIIGTVLGGLWADDSWGRFWGWDPKENGALIIVLWNALVLHARWDGMVKDRGLAVLAVAGNICTAWSWFGVNELGVGLHSYGFTEGVLLALSVFVLSQLTIMGLGMLPREMWMTTANAAAPAGGTGARREGKPTDDAERLSSSGNHGGRRKKKRRNR